MNLIKSWRRFCYDLAKQPKVCTAGSRKILRGVSWSVPTLDNSLTLTHLGYMEERGTKLKQLSHYYTNAESTEIGVEDYLERVKKGSYGSIGVTTHGNLKKNFTAHGFCIQAYTLTLVKKGQTEVDIFYRTTEVVKKFGADLVFFRDRVLPHFHESLVEAPVTKVNFHIANASIHPMFFTLLAIEDKHWVKRMEEIREADPSFHRNCCRWGVRCITDKEAKFKQARRVGAALERVMGNRRVKPLVEYMKEF